MNCKYCKREIEADSIYCRFCGERQIKERRKKADIPVPDPKQLPSGTWFGRVMVGGERVAVSAPSEKEYYAKARAIKTGLIEIKKAPPKLTLQQAIRKYIDDHTAVASPASIRGYEVIYRNRFKDYMQQDIHSINFQKMINDEAVRLKPKTVFNSWGLVRMALKYADFPVPSVTLPQIPKSDGDFLDFEQIQKFLAAIYGEPAELAAILALHSLRQSELLDLTAADIHDGNIYINGATVQDKDNRYVHKDTNKNKSSTRTVPVLIPRLYELVPSDGQLVTLYPTSIRRGIIKACEAANVTPCSLHDLRRSFASLAYHLKWQDRTTMLVGGWSDLSTIKAVYEKLSSQDQQRDIKRMQKFYSKLVTDLATTPKK